MARAPASMTTTSTPVDRYRFVGPLYEAMTWQRVLIVGAGHGTDALACFRVLGLPLYASQIFERPRG